MTLAAATLFMITLSIYLWLSLRPDSWTIHLIAAVAVNMAAVDLVHQLLQKVFQ